ncbi:cmc1-like protein [Acrodontium crateriforme]|uniref:COX assembly mitochondrial protein n=1 Tax=Acrodontium crateriforme TaxID=150365 RepID=A0AAQ3RCQ5_9PEZI|nr:cmc1-like protein [Acrodontium crateriforme]
MHPHLHTKDNTGCTEIMNALEECHAKGFLWKCMGMCSGVKHEVNMCLRAERLARTAKNREDAKAKRDHMKAVWAEIDANS